VIHRQRVIFGDTDQMGVVYYANYLRYFEAARAAFLRNIGSSYRAVEELGVALPVVEVRCSYHRPARFEDLLDIDVQVTELRGASMRFAYEVRRGDERLASGFTLHACVNAAGRPRRLPQALRALIGPVPRG